MLLLTQTQQENQLNPPQKTNKKENNKQTVCVYIIANQDWDALFETFTPLTQRLQEYKSASIYPKISQDSCVYCFREYSTGFL